MRGHVGLIPSKRGHGENPLTLTDAEQRNRFAWQCRRGMRELDILLKVFMETRFETLDGEGRRRFAELLGCPDALLFEWLTGRMVPADREVAEIVAIIRDASAA
jgi:antitoxin CptB